MLKHHQLQSQLEFREEIKLCFPTVVAGFRATLLAFATCIYAVHVHLYCVIYCIYNEQLIVQGLHTRRLTTICVEMYLFLAFRHPYRMLYTHIRNLKRESVQSLLPKITFLLIQVQNRLKFMGCNLNLVL